MTQYFRRSLVFQADDHGEVRAVPAVFDPEEDAVDAFLEMDLAVALIHAPGLLLAAAGPDELVFQPDLRVIVAADGHPQITRLLEPEFGVGVVDAVLEAVHVVIGRAERRVAAHGVIGIQVRHDVGRARLLKLPVNQSR